MISGCFRWRPRGAVCTNRISICRDQLRQQGTRSPTRAQKRPRLSPLTVEINAAGFSKLYNVAPWKNLPKQRSLDKHSTHRDWRNEFGDVGHSLRSKG